MAHKLFIRDVTLRDGQQSSFATRMSQQQIDRVLSFYKNVGFYAMEVWGGAVPDTIMRYLNENPWERLEKIKAVVGKSTKLTALCRGRDLFGYNPYPDAVVKSLCRNTIESGIDIMRIFDAMNDIDNMKSAIKYTDRYGGMVDCAVCYSIDPHHSALERIEAALHGHPLHKPVFTNDYFLSKAQQMEHITADIITLEDANGLITPRKTAELVRLFKKELKAPIDFHTRCTAGYGLASMLSAIVNGVDIVDTNIWYFAGGYSAPAIELIYVFCKKMGIELDIDMEAIACINSELLKIRKELKGYDTSKELPNPFDPLTDKLPTEIDRFFNDAIDAARKDKEEDLLIFCHAIEEYFNFPSPDEIVQKSQIPASMFNQIVAQLKQQGHPELLEKTMMLIPRIRMDAGLPPLVTPVNRVIASQAVSSALCEMNGQPIYSKLVYPFVSLVRGEYGKTPLPIDPEFRLQITGDREEHFYDASDYEMEENPFIEELGILVAENEKEVLLLELFPMVARNFLTKRKKDKFRDNMPLT
ncbi:MULTISPECIES: carboxylase [Parabacteroides]|uniref:carboxylase n=1 Tax=Parabacteroides leei TaxID=2939491 RepID=UPI00189A6580|nr:carboxylase [Parabacteroides goldsteinii]